jgi:hypothetical protein
VRYLEIEYRPAHWVHQLRAEIAKTPALAAADARWSGSRLLDLAFALETRIGNLDEIARLANENIRLVVDELQHADIDHFLEGGYAYRVRNQVALRRVIIALNSMIVESRSCFETLAKFYREFVRNYFNETLSKEASYAKVAATVDAEGWADDLGLNRSDILHGRSPWIRFAVQSGPRQYQPVLILEYRIDAPAVPRDEIGVEALEALQRRLGASLEAIRRELIDKVRTLQ